MFEDVKALLQLVLSGVMDLVVMKVPSLPARELTSVLLIARNGIAYRNVWPAPLVINPGLNDLLFLAARLP